LTAFVLHYCVETPLSWLVDWPGIANIPLLYLAFNDL
jgi:hypothetical protein